ncbi:MAG: hypothetical protein KatS3mg119_1393 [Rhodothalassiaceae bacterium]|nr:MAG: hypothetical protein KatS3mg119_1393 [Rhodothalassiaceae bacterium]
MDSGLPSRELAALDRVVVRFAGDSGDGIQLTGTQFASATALAGNDLATFPDYPAEIRAPAGTTFGVSAYQIQFGSGSVLTAGDEPDVLVALNPAALKVNLPALREGALVIVDTGAFTTRNLQKAGFETNPLTDETLSKYQVLAIDISKLTLDAVKDFGLSNKEALRCKNMWTLGLVLWMFTRPRKPVIDWLACQVRERSADPRRQHRGAERRPRLRRDRGARLPHSALPRRAGAGGARRVPHDHGLPGHRLGAGRGRAQGGSAGVLRLLSHHAGLADPA